MVKVRIDWVNLHGANADQAKSNLERAAEECYRSGGTVEWRQTSPLGNVTILTAIMVWK